MEYPKTEKPLVLFVDNDKDYCDTLIGKLRDLVGGRGNRPFTDFYQFEPRIVNLPGDVSLSHDKLDAFAQALFEEYSNEKHPLVIFVDLCMFHLQAGDRTGIDIADALRKKFRQVPVWVYTQVEWTPDALYFASIKAIDGILNLQVPERQADQLLDLLKSCHDIQQETLAASLDSLFGAPSWFEIEWEGDPGDNGRFAFKSAAEALGFRFFGEHKDIGKLVFSQLNPGFSGTKLIKVKPFDKHNE